MLKKKRIVIVIILILVVGLGIFFLTRKPNKEKIDIGYRTDVNILEIKNEKGIVGDDDLYELVEEYDGRKTLSVKSKYLFEVALVGLYERIDDVKLLNNNSTINEIEQNYEIAKGKLLKGVGGLIIPDKDQSKLLKIINDNTNNKYYFDENNYLKISNESGQETNLSEFDKRIIEKINSDNTLIISFEKEYYSIDDVTGEIISYPFCEIDPYSEYDSIHYENYEIRFVNPDTNTTSFLAN